MHRSLHTNRSKRVRSPPVQQVSTGSHRPFLGVRGRVYSATQAELQHSSQPGRSNSFSPIVVRNQGDPEQHEDDQRIDWQPISPDDAQDSARLHSSDKRSRHQHTREQQYFHWQEELAANVYCSTCALASGLQRRSDLQHRMQGEFTDRFNAADKECWRCNTGQHIQAVLPPTAITYASIHAHVSVHKPEFECTSCSTRIAVHPISIDCFPATPCQATVWYDQQLLVATAAAQYSGPVATKPTAQPSNNFTSTMDADRGILAFGQICLVLHRTGTVWRYAHAAFVGDHVSSIAALTDEVHMLVSQVEMSKREQFQLPGMFADQSAWQNCPCCWRTCQALMGDACLGITRLRAAASSSHALSPVYTDGPFVADAAVKDLLSERQNVDRALLDPPS
ncbi:TPA: hypothetical protein ACH3X1_008665 [Trebouxia sp. C0004]